MLRFAMLLLVTAMSITHVRGEPAQGDHCRRHPLHTIPEAAHALMDELRAGR